MCGTEKNYQRTAMEFETCHFLGSASSCLSSCIIIDVVVRIIIIIIINVTVKISVTLLAGRGPYPVRDHF
jgi:hypothetical protein